MGANGSFASGSTNSESGRRWHTLFVSNKKVKYIELKNKKDSIKLPEESHSPNSIYAIFNKPDKNGSVTLKAFAIYGSDGKKLIEVHTTNHKQLGAHYHEWKDGHPLPPKSLTPELQTMLNNIINLK